jgi:hypothetical protein
MTTLTATTNATSPWAISADTTGTIVLQSNGITAVTIDTSQNIGIGTSSPSSALSVVRSSGEAVISITNSGTASAWLTLNPSTTGAGYIHNITNTATIFTTNGTERLKIDANGNIIIGNVPQIKSSRQSVYAGATNATTYNSASFQGGSILTVQHQQTTSVSTSPVVIATTGIYATLALVFGSDGTNRFQDLVMFGLGTGSVNVITSFTVSGSPAVRTYSQTASTYRLTLNAGTYTVQFSGLSQGD